jgi:hypothetical protein
MSWRRPHEPPKQSQKPPLGLGVKAPLRRFAALTPASLRLGSEYGSHWLPLLDEQERLSSSETRSR